MASDQDTQSRAKVVTSVLQVDRQYIYILVPRATAKHWQASPASRAVIHSGICLESTTAMKTNALTYRYGQLNNEKALNAEAMLSSLHVR